MQKWRSALGFACLCQSRLYNCSKGVCFLEDPCIDQRCPMYNAMWNMLWQVNILRKWYNLNHVFSMCFDTHHMNASQYFTDLCAKCILVKLSLPEGFDLWLSQTYFTAFKDHLPDAWFQWGDTVSNKVLCTVQMSIITVSLLRNIPFNLTHNHSSIQTTSPQALKHTAWWCTVMSPSLRV